ncbi:hypothetical protein Vadar_027558 [Vaccinium darrowii]|uniref:Uncharacterized protein n=1 Tax=Vaccinium darrowii TaxID=229202 RepID=A0ACB7Z718_9ERIC|nr:hypothetical protein Vadar_027558 [Vaccinium darrowii]
MANATSLLPSFLLLTFLFSLLVHSSEPKSDPDVVRKQFLDAHNAVRASHGLPPLGWSREMKYYAQWWADKQRVGCQLIHSALDYGENIFWGEGNGWTATEAVEAWAAEEQYYDYWTNTCMPGRDCTHYTQIVWRTTTSVGCAKIKCDNGDTYIVCEYYPHGNVIGEWPY